MFATSNKPELVDEAILTRLYPIMFQELPVEHLMIKVNSILENTGVSSEKKLDVVEKIKTKLMSMDNPTIRDAQQFTIVECIEGGIWQ
jgi:hypothetical protein